MQPHKIKVIAHPSIELLERVLRVIRHRGGTIYQVIAYKENDIFNIEIAFYLTRKIEYVTQQLKKLVDVQDIEIISIERVS